MSKVIFRLLTFFLTFWFSTFWSFDVLIILKKTFDILTFRCSDFRRSDSLLFFPNNCWITVHVKKQILIKFTSYSNKFSYANKKSVSLKDGKNELKVWLHQLKKCQLKQCFALTRFLLYSLHDIVVTYTVVFKFFWGGYLGLW